MSSVLTLKYWMRTRSHEQRILILLSWLVVCVAIWYMAWESSYLTRQSLELDRIQTLKEKIANIDQQIVLKQKVINDPVILKEHQQLVLQLNDLDGQLRSVYTQLVSSSELVKAMKNVLAEDSGLKLLELANTGNIALTPPYKKEDFVNAAKENGKPMDDIRLYRHNFTMVFSGNYITTLDYFKKIEKLPWKFYWDSVNYAVTKYPEAKITIKLHTISTSQEVMNG